MIEDRTTHWHSLLTGAQRRSHAVNSPQAIAHRPHTAPSCPMWIAHRPLPVACGPLPVAPIILACGWWLK